jgi:hypothetical protein
MEKKDKTLPQQQLKKLLKPESAKRTGSGDSNVFNLLICLIITAEKQNKLLFNG